MLGDRLGPLLLQFPYFSKNVFASRDPFEKLLRPFLKRWPKTFALPWRFATRTGSAGVKTYVFFNNHYAGFAPGSVKFFEELGKRIARVVLYVPRSRSEHLFRIFVFAEVQFS